MTAVETPAATAWAMMARPAEPMPPGAAVDWLRERMDTDDVAAVKLALFRTAADALEPLRPVPPDDEAEICPALRNGDWSYAKRLGQLAGEPEPKWLPFWDAVAAAVPLFAAIEAA